MLIKQVEPRALVKAYTIKQQLYLGCQATLLTLLTGCGRLYLPTGPKHAW